MRKKTITGHNSTRFNTRCSEPFRVAEPIPGWVAKIEYLDDNARLTLDSNGRNVTLFGKGFTELAFVPDGENWCLFSIYDDKLHLVEWYFDISKSNFIDGNGNPAIDDLYLDIVIYPDGERVLLDEDELQAVLVSGDITQAEYDFAYRIAQELEQNGMLEPALLSRLCEQIMENIT